MGRQVNYFVDQQDLIDVLAWLEKAGMLAVSFLGPTKSMLETRTPSECILEDAAQRSSRICLVSQAISVAGFVYGPCGDADGISKLNSGEFPTIEFSPVKMDASGWARGRVYFRCCADCPQYREGLNAYERIARMLRKWPKFSEYRTSYHIGPHLAQRIRSGELAGPTGYGEIVDS